MSKFVAMPLPDGSLFRLCDLPWAQVEEIEKAHGTSWIYIIDAPQVNGAVLADVARAVAVVNGLDAPQIVTAGDLAAISASLVVVDEHGEIVVDVIEREAAELEPLAWAAD